MPHRFKPGDPIFYTPKEKEHEVLKGMYNIIKPNSDGTVYRIVDKNGDFTDADESEIQPLIYAVFILTKHGWPIIVPIHDEKLYNHFCNSENYKFHIGGPADICIKEQIRIMQKLEQDKEI